MEHISHWIAAPTANTTTNAPLFRREFRLDAEVASATLDICGLGYYEAWINGQRVGDHVLDPAQTDYERRVFYVTYDVTAHLSAAGNCIGVMLGNGFYNQDRVWENIRPSYGQPRLWLHLRITLDDGSMQTINSDATWTCAPGPITDNNVYAGECYDARLEQPGWNAPGFDDVAWQPAVIQPDLEARLEQQVLPPIRKIEELVPVSINALDDGCTIVDMGQNFAGWARISVDAPAGTEIQMRFAEALADDGHIDTASTGVFATFVEQVDRYICKGGGEERWEPRFTYNGFRYVEVTGWPGELTADQIAGVVVHTDLPVAGHFECSDARLNQLHSMAVWTHRSNIHSIPEDCPARERCGWLGDANVVAEFSMWNYQAKTLWQKYVDDIETTRAGNKGIPCDIAPGKRGTVYTGNPDWAATFIMLPWYVYVQYGDASVLEKHWPGMVQLMQHYKSSATGWILEGGYGDWFDPGAESICTHTPPTLTTSLWFYRCATVMRDAAAAIGHSQESTQYAEWAQCISEAIVDAYYQTDAGTFGSQTADAMALHFDIVPDGELSRVVDALVRDIRERDMHLNTGIMGVRYIFEVLSQYGHGDIALALMHQDTYPSFGDLIHRGATTLWESWGEVQHDVEHGPRSLNHPMMGGFDNWFFNTLAGIRPDPAQPGFRHFYLEPHPSDGVDWANAEYECPYGRIVSNWTYREGTFTWQVEIPEGCRATVTLPFNGQQRELEPGTYTLSAIVED